MLPSPDSEYFCGMGQFEYSTLRERAEGKWVEKKSRFLAFAVPVDGEDAAEEVLHQVRKTFYDARHVCYAYRIRKDGETSDVCKVSDNGEPSGTAGRPILAVIKSAGLTNVMFVVVRYFGGIKLGTSGLCAAYAAACREALKNAVIVHHVETRRIEARFEFAQMQAVMRILSRFDAKILNNYADAAGYSLLSLNVKACDTDNIIAQLKHIPHLSIAEADEREDAEKTR